MSARAKGKNYERHVGKHFAVWWGVPWKNPGKLFHPTPLSGGWDRERAGNDLLVPRDFPFGPECKNREGWDMRLHLVHGQRKNGKCPRNGTPAEWWEQTVEACPANKLPILVFTRRRITDYVLIDARTQGFIWDRCGPFRELARFPLVHNLRLFTMEQLLSLDPDALRVTGKEHEHEHEGRAGG